MRTIEINIILVQVYQTRKFISYWWPIPQDDIDKNWNLVQTPDWTVGNQ